MKQQLYYTNFAQAYGEGSYSECTYNNTESCTTSGSGSTGSGSGSSGGLANTGFDMLVIVTIACALIFIGLLIRIIRKKKHAKAGQSAQQSLPTNMTTPSVAAAPNAPTAPTAPLPPSAPQPPTTMPPQTGGDNEPNNRPNTGGPTNLPPRQI